MRFWWVNQNQTYRHEVRGGYLWSPKRKANNAANPFYDFMREVAPGDVVFSFADTLIRAIGIAGSYAYEAPKPIEFAATGAYWEKIGWRVDVNFQELPMPLKPASYMDVIKPVLPSKYAPLQPNGAGLQSVYLTRVSNDLGSVLLDLLGGHAQALVTGLQVNDNSPGDATVGLLEWEEHEITEVNANLSIPETERQAIVQARRGQGLFKKRVLKLERACRITGVDQLQHLRASHCRPWRDSSNEQRLDGENGLLLTPSIDHLFDRGFISFDDGGELLISPVAHKLSLERMGIDFREPKNVGTFSSGQRKFLEFHRENVLLRSSFLAKL